MFIKRATSDAPEMNAEDQGKIIIDNPIFADFSRTYAAAFNLPKNLLTNVDFLLEPGILR